MKYELPTTVLGRTGLRVTRLGIGGAYCESPEGYAAALDCGITYVDTARAYHDGKDEEYVGAAIKGRRDGLVISTKTVERSADKARQELETSLKLLGTDHVDVWHMHYVNSEEDVEKLLAPGGALEAARRAQEEGLVQFVGVTGHNWEIVQRAVATGEFDNVLCWYNCAYREAETTVFPAAAENDTGVVIMNASRQNKLITDDGPDPALFYRYVLSNPQVNVTLKGLRDVTKFLAIAQALSDTVSLSDAERAEVEAYGRAMRAEGKLEM